MNTVTTAGIRTFAAIVALGALLGGLAATAQAADAAYGSRTKKVSLSDLDLSTIAGQETARVRLHQMARRLCGQVEEDLDVSRQSNFVKCVEAATAQSRPHLDAMIRGATAIRTAANDSPK